MKICGYCGSQLDDAAVACAYCGRVIVADGDPEAAKAQQQQAEQAAANEQAARQAGTQGPAWQQEQARRDQQGEQQPYGGQQPYGNQQPYGSQQPYGNQQPYGSQQPYGNQQPYSNQQQYGGYTPYGNQQPYGQPDPLGRQQPVPEGKINVCGLISFILGLASLFFGAFYCVTSIAAIILGIVALVQHAKKPGVYRLKGFAIAGLVLGIVTALFWGAMLIIALRFVSNWMNNGGSIYDTQGLYDYIYQYFGGGFTLF